MPFQGNTIFLSFTGKIHNLADLRRQLNIAEGETLEVLTAAWLRWGELLAEKLVGDYALAIRDDHRHIIYLARDPLGVKPLYYRVTDKRLEYGFSIPQLRGRCHGRLTQDMDWAAAYMLNLSFSQTDTAYKEIKKLAPGHRLSFSDDGCLRIHRYHHWHDAPPAASVRDPRWVNAYRSVLEEAIRCRMDLKAPMGTENSGGIDSATITAYLADFLGEPGDRLHSFSFALCEQEPTFILETSRAKRIRHNYIITDRYEPELTQEGIARSLAILGAPEEHSNASGHIPFYLECQRRGISSLFSGFGGDEVVTSHGNHLRWELWDNRQYIAMWGILSGSLPFRILRLLKLATVGRIRPSHNPLFLKIWQQRWPYQLLRPEVVQRLNLYERYMDTAIHDGPYRRTNDFILNHHLQRMQLTARLENCSVLAAAYGIDYQWPLWDARLVQQYLSTPAIEKVGPNGISRYLHRRAIDGVVPASVAWKPSKDMGYARRHREVTTAGLGPYVDIAKESLTDLHPALEQLIDNRKLHQQVSDAITGRIDWSSTFRKNVVKLAWMNTWLHLGE